MGPDSIYPEPFIYDENNGKWMGLQRIVNVNLDDCQTAAIQKPFQQLGRATETVTIDISNKFHMSKKRFKKILMGKGMSRDDADWICWTLGTMKGKVSYRDTYLNSMFLRPYVPYYEVFDYILTKGEYTEWINTK